MSHQGYYLHPDTGKPVTGADWPLGITKEEYDRHQKEQRLLDALNTLFPQLRLFIVDHKCRDIDGYMPLSEVITHLNDFHEWSITDVADYVETLDVDLCIRKEVDD